LLVSTSSDAGFGSLKPFSAPTKGLMRVSDGGELISFLAGGLGGASPFGLGLGGTPQSLFAKLREPKKDPNVARSANRFVSA
jgi:hypothetical protein